MDKNIEKEVEDVLRDPDNVDFENLQAEEFSPLNQAVIEKEITGTTMEKDWNVWKPDSEQSVFDSHKDKQSTNFQKIEIELDAPEQEIGGSTTDINTDEGGSNAHDNTEEKEEFELPTATAKQAADTILGMSNNFLAVGGGYFVKIKKHKEFYDFDEIVELIDNQNDKNVTRIKLDKEDKALLKPLLVAMLKKKAKALTPEQQLTGALLSILVKKAQVVMEVRAENDLLVDRILDIVREEKGYSDKDLQEEGVEGDHSETMYANSTNEPVSKSNETLQEEKEDNHSIIENAVYDDEPHIMDTVMEVVEESK